MLHIRTGNLAKRLEQCSFTVEMAFIMPIIIAGIIVCIWLCFYLKNRARMIIDTSRIEKAGKLLVTQGKDPVSGVNNYADVINRSILYRLSDCSDEEIAGMNRLSEQMTQTGYQLCFGIKSDIRLTKGKVAVMLEYDSGLSDGLIADFVSMHKKEVYIDYCEISDRSEINRIIKLAYETASSIKAVEAFLKK